MRLLVLAAACVLAAESAPHAAAAQTAEGEFRSDLNGGVWQKGPPLPAPRQDAACAVVGGRIYLIGGFGPRDAQTDTTFVLEPQVPATAAPAPFLQRVGRWTTAAPIPVSVDHAAAAALDGYVYVVGGRQGRRVSGGLWRYDPSADAWEQLASMPIARYAPTLTAFGEKLYVLGGQSTGGRDERSVEMFDPLQNMWTLISRELDIEREAAAAAVVDQKIALVGGHDHAQDNLTSCDLWDPLADAWSTCARLHDPRADFGLAAVEGRLMAIGGYDLRRDLADQTTEISEPAVRGWLSGPWMPFPRRAMAVASIGGTIFVMGGSAYFGVAPLDSVLLYVSPITRVRLGPRVRP